MNDEFNDLFEKYKTETVYELNHSPNKCQWKEDLINTIEFKYLINLIHHLKQYIERKDIEFFYPKVSFIKRNRFDKKSIFTLCWTGNKYGIYLYPSTLGVKIDIEIIFEYSRIEGYTIDWINLHNRSWQSTIFFESMAILMSFWNTNSNISEKNKTIIWDLKYKGIESNEFKEIWNKYITSNNEYKIKTQ